MEKRPPTLGSARSPEKQELRRDAFAPIQEPWSGWEEPDCLLCGGRRRTLFVRGYDNASPDDWQRYSVVRCLDCGLCFTSPRPTTELMGRFYPESYEPHEPPDSPCRLPLRSQLASWCGWPLEARRALPWHGQGRLLDFGCGGGSFLQRMQRQGWRVTGVDVSPLAIQRIRDELHLHALLGSLPHSELQAGSFDVITMWHSLEHVHEPMTVLREAHRLLAPGGRLLVAAPNLQSLPFRWFGSAWYGLDLPRHLIHFSPATLRKMLERAGFRVSAPRMLRHSGWLRASAGLAMQGMAAQSRKRWMAGKITSRLITAYCSMTRQADCILITAEL